MTRLWWALVFVLAGCAQQPVVPPLQPQALLHDDSFTKPAQPIDASEIFAVDDAMRAYLREGPGRYSQRPHRAGALVDALYKRGELKLEYDSSRTRNAQQAFAARAGNCLSLVVMTAALAKELDLQVEYSSAYTEEVWSRSGA